MSPLRIAVISDIHLGHPTTSTRSIIDNLRKAFPDNPETADLDIIFLAGDVFDSRLNLPQDEVWEIKVWVGQFLRLCSKHDIMVRVLKGTSSHDWDQSKIFENTNHVAEIGADLKYIDDLSIEYIERYGISVLYVPDDLEGGPDKTLSRVHSLLAAKAMTQVDYAIMHGQFEYQLPEHVKAPKHSSAEYRKIVKRLIFIGHVHTYSSFMDFIFAQGSFDRLSHGQEEAKGHLRAKIYEDHFEMTFVENTSAKRYVTIDLNGFTSEESIERIDKVISTLPSDSHVRLRAKPGHPVVSNIFEIMKRHPTFHWVTKEDKEKEVEEETIEDEIEFVAIQITPSNITGMLLDRLMKRAASTELITLSSSIIEEEIRNVV
jgi:DNA repair exonuclease SbcCD nuclease subunit